MKKAKSVETLDKVKSACSWLMLIVFILASGAPALSDDPSYILTGVRIVSRCNAQTNPNGPQIPPPLVAEAFCPSVHPNKNWSFDISWFDPIFQKYYLADRDNAALDIVDTQSNTVVGQATGFVGAIPLPPFPPDESDAAGPNGVLTTHNPDQLWGGDGNGDVRVYSLDSNGLNPTHLTTILHTDPKLNVTHRADELAYDPDDQLILMAWDHDTDLLLAFISVSPDASGIKVVGTISLKGPANCPVGGCSTGGIEQPAYDPKTGRFLVSVPASTQHPNGEVLVINPHTMAAEKAYDTTDPLTGSACRPNGLALGPSFQAILGCSSAGGPQLVTLIIDVRTGNVIKTITQVGGSDEVWYNPGDNHYYTASSNFTSTGLAGGAANPVVGIIDAGSGKAGPEWIQNISTGASSHSVAAVFGFQCDQNPGQSKGKSKGKGKGNDNGNGNGNNNQDCNSVVNNRVWVPLRINTATSPSEVGGIGVISLVP